MIRSVTGRTVPMPPPVVAGKDTVEGVEQILIAPGPRLHDGQPGRCVRNEHR